MPKATAICRCALGCLLLLFLGCALDLADADTVAAKVPITTDSAAAQRLYEEGRDLVEKVRLGDAHQLFSAAVERDSEFALAYLMLASTGPDEESRRSALDKAIALAATVSDGERAMILGQQAERRGDSEEQLSHYQELVAAYPEDERALALIGNFHFERGEFPLAITYFRRATAVDPEFTQAYNQMGYAYRYIERWTEAEQSFLQYIELMPEEANPYDSYAEMLMKMGRFEDSLVQYHAALSRNPGFIPSIVGVGNNQLFLGDPANARKTFEKLLGTARSDREKHQAGMWTAVSYLHEGSTDHAVDQLEELRRLSVTANMPGDAASYQLLQSSILLEKGALDRSRQILEKITKNLAAHSDSEARWRENVENRVIFLETRLALARGDLNKAAQKLAVLEERAEKPSQRQSLHELQGQLALAQGQPEVSLEYFAKARQEEPRILWLQALTCKEIGDFERMRELAGKVSRIHEFDSNLFVAVELALLKPKVDALLATT